MIEYTVYDIRTAEVVGRSYQPDISAASENAAILSVGFNRGNWQYAAVETRELSG